MEAKLDKAMQQCQTLEEDLVAERRGSADAERRLQVSLRGVIDIYGLLYLCISIS